MPYLRPPTVNPDELPVAQDRDAAWTSLANTAPVVQLPGGLGITTMTAAEEVLKDPSTFSSKRAFDLLASPAPMVPVAFDPPEHTRYRKILQPFFTPRAIRGLESNLRSSAISSITEVMNRGECEFVAEFAQPFPVRAFMSLFGLPGEDRDQLEAWTESIFGLFTADGVDAPGYQEKLADAAAFYQYLIELVAQRRDGNGDDVLTLLLHLDGADALSDEEALGLTYLFVLAGLDTVSGALSFGMQRLALDASLRSTIVTDPSKIPAMVEEIVRLDTSTPFVPRVATRDVEIEGYLVPRGTAVNVYTACANRDESRFSDPGKIDLERSVGAHAGFGLGPHRCLGSHLARLELQVFLEEWHKRIPEYAIKAGYEPHAKWPRGTTGLESLHLTFART